MHSIRSIFVCLLIATAIASADDYHKREQERRTRKKRCVVKKGEQGLSLICGYGSSESSAHDAITRTPRSKMIKENSIYQDILQRPLYTDYTQRPTRRSKVRIKTKCKELFTDWVNATMTSSLSLLSVNCPHNQLLNSVRFETQSEQQIRCKFKCCSMVAKM